MEEKLVTLAIHSFEKAQILKTILENQGVSVYLHNVNLIQPVISAGVRVRIKESDLPAALRIIEDAHFSLDDQPEKKQVSNRLLVPVDFSTYSFTACKFAFQYAKENGLEVTVLHVYFSPFFANPIPLGDITGYDLSNENTLRDMTRRVNDDLMSFKQALQQKMEEKEIPYVKFEVLLREGVPEEEIIRFARKYEPRMIVMGTRGSNQKDIDIIGSVTAEVIDRTRVPLLAIPEKASIMAWKEMKRVAFLTNFEERDLVSFEALAEFLKESPCDIYFYHLAERGNSEWNKIKLDGVKSYFSRQYPDKNIFCQLIEGENQLEDLDRILRADNIDIMALTNKRRNIFARLFNPSMAKRMLFHSDTPLLVFP